MTTRDRTGEPVQPALDEPDEAEAEEATTPDVARQHIADMRQALRGDEPTP